MRVKVLTDKEYQFLVAALPKHSPRDELIIRLMLQCGLRSAETATVTVGQVWRGGSVNPGLYIPGSVSKGHVGRVVDIPEVVQDTISKYIRWMITKDLPTEPAGRLFYAHKTRGPLQPRDIQRIVNWVGNWRLERHIHPHMLRHTYATRLLKFTNIRVVQQLLGHKSLATTQIYLHPTSEDCSGAVNKAFTA